MNIKILGLFIVIISCSLMGVSVYEKYYRRTVFLKSYLEFIIYLKNEINYKQNQIFSVLENYNSSTSINFYISKLLNYLKKYPLEYSWSKTFEKISSENGVSQDEENIIKEFGKQLCSLDLEMEINILHHHIETLKIHLNEAIDVKKSKGKLPIILGLSIGFFIAIIFI